VPLIPNGSERSKSRTRQTRRWGAYVSARLFLQKPTSATPPIWKKRFSSLRPNVKNFCSESYYDWNRQKGCIVEMGQRLRRGTMT
jgi:hypothetical protein